MFNCLCSFSSMFILLFICDILFSVSIILVFIIWYFSSFKRCWSYKLNSMPVSFNRFNFTFNACMSSICSSNWCFNWWYSSNSISCCSNFLFKSMRFIIECNCSFCSFFICSLCSSSWWPIVLKLGIACNNSWVFIWWICFNWINCSSSNASISSHSNLIWSYLFSICFFSSFISFLSKFWISSKRILLNKVLNIPCLSVLLDTKNFLNSPCGRINNCLNCSALTPSNDLIYWFPALILLSLNSYVSLLESYSYTSSFPGVWLVFPSLVKAPWRIILKYFSLSWNSYSTHIGDFASAKWLLNPASLLPSVEAFPNNENTIASNIMVFPEPVLPLIKKSWSFLIWVKSIFSCKNGPKLFNVNFIGFILDLLIRYQSD